MDETIFPPVQTLETGRAGTRATLPLHEVENRVENLVENLDAAEEEELPPMAQRTPEHTRFTDLTGLRFGALEIAYYTGLSEEGKSTWMAECICGGFHRVTTDVVIASARPHCGCLKRTSKEEKDARILQAWKDKDVEEARRLQETLTRLSDSSPSSSAPVGNPHHFYRAEEALYNDYVGAYVEAYDRLSKALSNAERNQASSDRLMVRRGKLEYVRPPEEIRRSIEQLPFIVSLRNFNQSRWDALQAVVQTIATLDWQFLEVRGMARNDDGSLIWTQ